MSRYGRDQRLISNFRGQKSKNFFYKYQNQNYSFYGDQNIFNFLILNIMI